MMKSPNNASQHILAVTAPATPRSLGLMLEMIIERTDGIFARNLKRVLHRIARQSRAVVLPTCYYCAKRLSLILILNAYSPVAASPPTLSAKGD
ncbi:MAG: hypothetical protein C5B49_06875 [Bdellovibrio sp.]|nr:MAG: hypothetical protein C5B49_06875 [Bdellovibrio sp.]